MASYSFIGGDGRTYGPCSAEQVRQYMAENRVTAQSQVSANGGPWQPAVNFQELMGGAHAPHPSQAVQPPMAGVVPLYQNYRKQHRGVLILVLGILSIVLGCWFFTGIPAWVMGNNDLKEMDQGIMDPSGRGLTQGGRVTGMIATIFSCGCGGLYFIFVLIAIVAEA
mgnify:CR=1 FL=1|jgi:hypothetical protein